LSHDTTLKLDFLLSFIGLGAFLYTDMFIRVVGIWELGRTLVTSTIETIVPTLRRTIPQLQHYGLNLTMFSPFA